MSEIRYHAAASLQEAEQLLRSNPGARPLAGGTDLFGALKDSVHGNGAPVDLVDLKTVPGLDGVTLEGREVVIGALTRLADLASSELIDERLPMLAGATRSVASPQLREMGTVGGNLCQEPRCWYYRNPGDLFHCHRKSGELCAAALGDDRYHSVFGAVRVVDPYCTQACPNHTSIPVYVEMLRDLEIETAARTLLTQNPMPAITGRICPHLCETGCTRADIDEPVSIHSLEREVGDYVLEEPAVFVGPEVAPSGSSVTVVGSGPAGLTAAYYLRRAGHAVTVLERETRAGGALSFGIPPFRLSRAVVDRVVDLYTTLGVRFGLGVEVGRDITLEEIRATSDAVIVASGACLASRIGIEGEDATVAGLDYLRRAAIDEHWRESGAVVVIGGGNVAVDSAMTAMARGAERVTMVCLESRDEMPAFDAEVTEALRSGIELKTQWGPRRVRLEGSAVAGVDLVCCSSVFDSEGAFCPTLDESVTDFVAAGKVILAVGQRVDREWFKDCLAPEAGSARGTFVCGDAESGPATVVEAIASGRRAAANAHRLLTGTDLPEPVTKGAVCELLEVDAASAGRATRVLGERPVAATSDSAAFAVLDPTDITEEARRCLNCGCLAVSPSDLAPVFIALNARVQTSKRRLAVEELFAASVGGSTVLDDDEIVLAVRVPLPGPADGDVFQKFRERKSIDFPIVNLAVHVSVVGGMVADARLCAGAVAPVPLRLRAAERALVGRQADREACEQAAQAAVAAAHTLQGNVYKRQILEVMVRRSLEEAIGLAGGSLVAATDASEGKR
jgi:NADPH-dependent glutamate synthase beta subunit-like oxidoreductase/CO/xanthine dehydrogenase FAD-binding subunit